MTLRKIARLGQPVLLDRAVPVDDPGRPEIQTLVDDMLETMADAEGIGLAAPQVYVGLRVIVAMDLRDRSEAASAPVRVLLNPELEPLGEEAEMAYEGCLSIPELRGLVPRVRRGGHPRLRRGGRPGGGGGGGGVARGAQPGGGPLPGGVFSMRRGGPRPLAFTSELRHLDRWLAEERAR